MRSVFVFLRDNSGYNVENVVEESKTESRMFN